MEKAFDWVPREFNRFPLQRMGVPGYLVNGEISCPYRVCFESTLFVMVMDVKTEDEDGSLMELLYADDPISCGESLNKVMEKYRQ